MNTASSSQVHGVHSIFRHLQRHNIFYMISALLMLLGCFLISGPYLITLRREISGLLVLLGTINLYEGLVILACGYICRQAPRSSEGNTLLLIAQLFLLDVTFTINACLPVNFWLGVAVAAASFVLALLKIYVLERGVRRPIFSKMRAFQIASILFLYSFQGMLGLYPEGNVSWKQAAAFAVWTIYGLLPLLLFELPALNCIKPAKPSQNLSWLPSDLEGPPAQFPAPVLQCPWWQSDAFPRISCLLAMAMLGVQVLAQSWVYETPFAWSYFSPAGVVAAAALPLFIGVRHRSVLFKLRVGVVISTLMLLGWAVGGLIWRPGNEYLRVTLTPYRIVCLVAALSFLWLRIREKRSIYRDLACGCLWLGAISYDLTSLVHAFAGRAELAPVAAGVLAGAVWLVTRVRFPRALIFWLVSLVLVTRMLHAENVTCSSLIDALRWGPLGILTLCMLFGRGHTFVRVALLAMVWCWGVWSCVPTDGPALVYFYAAAAVMLAACALNRAFVPVVMLYLAASNVSVYGVPGTSYAAAWGWFSILLAFASLGLAFYLTRTTLQEAAASGTEPLA